MNHRKDNNFNLIRFLLATTVVFTHCFPLADGSTSKHPFGDTEREWFYILTNGQLFGGSIAVYFFFILSGYLVTQSFDHSKTVKEYLGKRVLRIFPAFLAWVIIGSFCVVPLSIGVLLFLQEFKPLAFIISTFLLQFPEIPRAFLTNPYAGEENGSLWTIKYEAAMYLLTALVGMIGWIKKRRALLLVALLFYGLHLTRIFAPSAIFEMNFSLYPFGTFWDYPPLLIYFFIGACFYLYRDKISYNWKMALFCLALILIGFFKYLEVILPLAGAYLLFFFGLKKNSIFKFTRNYDLSYGIYLNSFLIQQSLLQLFPEAFRRSPYLLFLATYPLSLFFAYLSWNYLEKKMLLLKKRLK